MKRLLTLPNLDRASRGMLWLILHRQHAGRADCLLWPYGKNSSGYGQTSIESGGKLVTASRIMCMLAHGEPEHHMLDAAHSCGNRPCVNPNHLRWATPEQNMQDTRLHKTGSYRDRAR